MFVSCEGSLPTQEFCRKQTTGPEGPCKQSYEEGTLTYPLPTPRMGFPTRAKLTVLP